MKPRSSYYDLIPYLRQEWQTIAQALVCTLLFTGFWPILAQLAGEIAELIGQGLVVEIAQLAAIAAGVFLLRGLAQYGQDALMAKAAFLIARDLRQEVYSHLHRLSLDYFETAKTGDLSYRLTEDVDRIGEAINKIFHQFLPSILQLIVVIGYMVYIKGATIATARVSCPLNGPFGGMVWGKIASVFSPQSKSSLRFSVFDFRSFGRYSLSKSLWCRRL